MRRPGPTFRTDGIWGFYPIVERPDQVRWLLSLGVRTLQLRAKDLHGAALREAVRDAVEAGRPHGAQIVINDAWSEALDAGAPFVHLGQGDLWDADVDAIHAAGVGLGISSHSPGERLRALDHRPAYVALGPVFATTLKRMPWAPQGMARVGLWKRTLPVPLVAIGGLTLERAPAVLRAGADAIAVVSDLRTPDPDARVRAWLTLFENRTERPLEAP